EAVSRNDVEAGAGKQRDRVPFAIENRLEDGDLARDVDVVRARFDARVHHRRACANERTSAMQDQRDAIERDAVERDAVERKRAPLATQLASERLDPLRVASRENGTMPTPHRLARDQLARIAVRSINEPLHDDILHPTSSGEQAPFACRYSRMARDRR